MNRREFLSTLVGGVSVNAAVRTWPFRVFSFPSKIVIPTHRFSFFEMFALNGPEMAEFLPGEFDMDLDTFMRIVGALANLGHHLTDQTCYPQRNSLWFVRPEQM